MICVIKIALNICQTLIKHKRFGFSGMLSITSSQAASHHYPPQNGSVCTERSSVDIPQQPSVRTRAVTAATSSICISGCTLQRNAAAPPLIGGARRPPPPTAPRRSTSLSVKASRRWHLACAVTARSHACARLHLLMCEWARASGAARLLFIRADGLWQKGGLWADEADKHLMWLYIQKSWLRAHIKYMKIYFRPRPHGFGALKCKFTLRRYPPLNGILRRDDSDSVALMHSLVEGTQ